MSRLGFVAVAGLLGMTFPLHSVMPIALASDDALAGKDGLALLNDLPLNAETPAHLLDDAITPTSRHFIRNNGLPPENLDAAGRTLPVDGLVDNPAVLSIDELRARFEVVSLAFTIECGGNGRASFGPPVGGEQWTRALSPARSGRASGLLTRCRRSACGGVPSTPRITARTRRSPATRASCRLPRR